MRSGLIRNKKYKKGVALIFAMFVAALLAAMSTTVVAVSINGTKDSSAVLYNDAALQAANWGIDAAVNYMGQPGYRYNPGKTGNAATTDNGKYYQWEETSNNFLPSLRLKAVNDAQALALNGSVRVVVTKVSSADLKSKYGLNFDGKKLGEDTWAYGDSSLIKFYDLTSKGEYKIDYYNGTFATVEVVCTENRYKNQPSRYQLYSVAKVYNGGKTGSAKNATLLATRVADASVRELSASDFMHFIQNARSWDANGVDLSWNNMTTGGNSARTAVLLPEGYTEQGRLRVDGYSKIDPEKNDLKRFLNGQTVGGRRISAVDGKIGFFSESGSFTKNQASKYKFYGDVYTEKGSGTYNYRSRGSHQDKSGDNLTGSFGSLFDNAGSMGLPQSGRDYFDDVNDIVKNKRYTTGAKAVYTVGANANTSSDMASVRSVAANKCPDIAQGTTTGYDNKGVKRTNMPASVPTFATVRVEICGDDVRILKYNTAVSNGNTGKNVENITPSKAGTYGSASSCKISDIKDGIISVSGGNVEIVNVTSFGAKGSGSNGYRFGNTDTKLGACDANSSTYQNAALDGQLTVVSDVNLARDAALSNVGKNRSTSANPGNGGIYSTEARKLFEKYQEDTTNTSIAPPYSARQLGTGSSNTKNIWPTPSTSSVEREGNVILGSDIVTKDGNSSFGVVANNFIYITDRAATSGNNYKSGSTDSAKKSRTLTIDGVLYSMDHSVQFDWNNLAGLASSAYNKLSGTISSGGLSDSIIKQSARIFRLNGAIVGGFLDVEGDTHGRGYYTQEFAHNNNLKYNLPPHFPKWDLKNVAMNGIFMPYVVLSYEDKGAINDFQ